jgi:hypothetical protein
LLDWLDAFKAQVCLKLQAEKIDISSLLIDQKQVLQAQIVRCYEESQTTQEEVDQSL